MSIQYLKKATKTSSSDETKTREVVQNILTELEKSKEEGCKELTKKFDKYEGEIIISKEKIDFVEKSDFLVNSLSDKSGSEFVYRMNFNNKKELQDFKARLDKEKNLEKVNVIYN